MHTWLFELGQKIGHFLKTFLYVPGHTSDVTRKTDDCINNLSSIAVINFEMKVQDLAI